LTSEAVEDLVDDVFEVGEEAIDRVSRTAVDRSHS